MILWITRLWDRLLYGLGLVFSPGNWQMMLGGLGITLQVTLFSMLLGVCLGVVIALMKLSGKRVFTAIASVYLAVIRGTPMMIQVMILWYSIFTFTDNKVLVAILAFALNSGAYVAEIVRAGIQAVSRGQMEAGRSLGMSYSQTMRYVIFHQAAKNALPPLGNEFIVLLKETSIVGMIALSDMTQAANVIRGATYNTTSLYVAAVTYLILVLFFTRLLGLLERRLGKSDSHRRSA